MSNRKRIKILIFVAALAVIIVSLWPHSPTHAQAPQYEVPCPQGFSPLPSGQSYNPVTNLFRANLCSDALGTVNFPRFVYNATSGSLAASIGATTMATVPASGATYRFSYYSYQTILGSGCSTNTTVQVTFFWTDPSGSSQTSLGNSSWTLTITNNGTLGSTSTIGGATPSVLIRAKGSTTIQYSTTYTQGTCTTGPSYQAWPMLEILQ